MKIVKSSDRYPEKPGYYKVLCVDGKFRRARFIPAIDGPEGWCPAHFRHRKRCLRAVAWVEKVKGRSV